MSRPPFRVCHNIKSRANPDIQCSLSATHGDYCSRHHKNPRPFAKPLIGFTRVYTRKDKAATQTIQKFWRRVAPLYRYRHHGPAANASSIAINETELFSMELISSIPKHYFVSFSDERKGIWVFDVRTIVHTMATGFPSENPYTREPLTEKALRIIHGQIAWLRARKYPLLHMDTDVLTPEQSWNHRVLDVFLKIESLGYYVNCEWFHALTLKGHIQFYTAIFSMWEFRLGLTRAEKERIIPGHAELQIFRFHPEDMPMKAQHWWQKYTLNIMETFIGSGTEKEQRKMGAMYVLMALTRVSRGAAEALPWLAT